MDRRGMVMGQPLPTHLIPETPINSCDPVQNSLTLPPGWKRQENVRPTGLSAGRVDVYYVSPDGKKFWTKPQLARYFGDSVDLSNFDFQSGRFVQPLIGSLKRSRLNSSAIEYSTMKTDTSLLPPIRQTASIFKQPVTVVKTQKSRVKMDFKHGIQESPRQLFWEKRLQGLRASDPSGSVLSPSELPQGIVPAGPHIDPDTVLHSIATALHLATHPITGQSGDRASIDSNPGVYINPDQPLIHEIAVSEDDIRAQEERVGFARKKLEEALLMFYPGSITRTDRDIVTDQDTETCNVAGKDSYGTKSDTSGGAGTIRSTSNPQKKLKLCQPSGQTLVAPSFGHSQQR